MAVNDSLNWPPLSRRAMLCRAGMGFGLLSLAGTLQSAGFLSAAPANPGHSMIGPHFPARAKRVIFLFMNGAPSHVDTLDPKPALQKHTGQKPSGKQDRKAK